VQTSVAILLLITASVVFSCVVIDYAIGIIQATMQTTSIPQLESLKNLENMVLNQTTAMWNQTLPTPTPTLPPT
jgi:hypothetical protein